MLTMMCPVCHDAVRYAYIVKDEPTDDIYVYFRYFHLCLSCSGRRNAMMWGYVLLHRKREHCTGVCCQSPYLILPIREWMKGIDVL